MNHTERRNQITIEDKSNKRFSAIFSNKAGDILRLFSFFLLPMSFFSCKVLFWSNARQWTSGVWVENSYLEMQLEYKSKMSWNPLNQNVMSRDFESVLLLHQIHSGSVEKTTELTRFPGWVLDHSLFLAGKNVVFIRGKGNDTGGLHREVVAVSLEQPSDLRVWVLESDHTLAAIPSPDGKILAVFSSDRTVLEESKTITVDFLDIEGNARTNPRKISGLELPSPGMPEISWAKDSSKLYIHQGSEVLETEGYLSLKKSVRFPSCFLPTSSGGDISLSGIRFFRQGEEGEIHLEKTVQSILFDQIPEISDPARIGSGCP